MEQLYLIYFLANDRATSELRRTAPNISEQLEEEIKEDRTTRVHVEREKKIKNRRIEQLLLRRLLATMYEINF